MQKYEKIQQESLINFNMQLQKYITTKHTHTHTPTQSQTRENIQQQHCSEVNERNAHTLEK